MRIGFYGRALANRAGIGRYARELLRAMVGREEACVRVYAGPSVDLSAAAGVEIVRLGGTGNRLWEEQALLPRALGNVDVFHNPDFTLPRRLPPHLPAVVTVHDVAYLRFPRSNSLKSKVLLGLLVPWSVRRAHAIVTVSEFSKREVIDAYRVQPEKIWAIPNGVDPRFRPQSDSAVRAVREKHGLPRERTVLYLGAIEERKNLLRLALATKNVSGARLVIAGALNRAGAQIVTECRRVLGDRLHELGYVPDEDLPALYASASVFAYPSLYEGFGIPPLEAMACGTVVAVSDATALPEAVGEAGLLFDPMNVDAMTAALCQALEDDTTRERLIEQGLARARTFTWGRVAEETMALYRRVA